MKNKQGYYVTGLGWSPENMPLNGTWILEHVTMDTALVREVMRHLLEGGKILKVDQDLWPVWQDLHDNVLPYPVNIKGVLKEWPEPYWERPDHRHFSHLYPLFPGDEFTWETTPKLTRAAEKAIGLRERGGHWLAWSRPWAALIHSRLGDGDSALIHLLQKFYGSNILTPAGPPWSEEEIISSSTEPIQRTRSLQRQWFQIEALLGASAAVSEMLLQSHGYIIRLLPALPEKWSEGQFRGLKARGAFVVDAQWSDAKLTQTRITSLKGRECVLQKGTPWQDCEVRCEGKLVLVTQESPNGLIRFETEENHVYLVVFH